MRIRNVFKRLNACILLCLVILLHVGVMTAQNTSPLCFTARNGSVTVRFDIKNVTHTIQYSTNGSTWSTYTSNTDVTISANHSVYFRAASNQTVATAFGGQYGNSSRFYFTNSNSSTVEGSGNMMSLYGPDCPNLSLQPYAFESLFYNCTSLTTAPSLPATTLAENCYRLMFYGCTSLTTAPLLPAATLSNYCYSSMFSGCISLTTLPSSLPATTLAYRCYSSMFSGCISLTTAPLLPAMTLTEDCYAHMFDSCTALTTAPPLPATALASYCYCMMFYGCTSLTTAPSLPATTLAENCYSRMFYGCTSLTTAPSLPPTTLTEQCYYYMFSGCTSLIVNGTSPGQPWIIQAATSATNALTGMFTGTGGTMNGTPSIGTTYYIATNYNISATPNDSSMGYVTGGGNFIVGTTATLSATPNAHYHFVNWSDGNRSNPRNIIVSGDSSFNAIFEIDNHTITATGTNGTVTGGGSYNYGSNISLSATPNSHYHFVKWTDGNTSNPRNVTVHANATYTAVFEGDLQTISVGGTNGTVTGEGQYYYGTTATLTATANQHYHFARWTDGNTSNPRYIIVSGDSSFNAIFELDKHTITATGTNGIVTGGGSYDYGLNISITAIPNAHYNFVSWSDGNSSNPRNIIISGDSSFNAIFEIDKHTITVTGTNGTVTGNGSYDYGSNILLTATPNVHYHFVSWSDGNSSNPRNIIVSGDSTFAAVFKIDRHTISVNDPNGTVTGTGEYDYFASAILTATSNEHCYFMGWPDGDTSMTKTIIVTSDTTFTHLFAINDYIVTATCEHGVVTGNGTYQYPDIVTLYVEPYQGYRFVAWSDSNKYNPRVFVVEGDLTVEAICEEAPVVGIEEVRECVTFYYVDGKIVNPEGGMLRVYSTNGKLMKSGDGNIATEGWPAGVYVVVDEKGRALKIVVR